MSGSWVEPSVSCNSSQDDVAFWVGIGGASQESHALEQVGTQGQCDANGNVHQFAWYELLPAPAVKLGLTISPGDHISAGVSVSGSNVTMALSDSTTGQSTTKTLQMNNPDTSSAEWIAEAPSQCGDGNCQPVPLADFNTVDFTGASATAGGHTGTISDSSWSSQPIALDLGEGGYMYGGDGYQGGGDPQSSGSSSAGASPSGLSTDGSSFSVAWQSSSSASSGAVGQGNGYPGADAYPGGGYTDPGAGYGDPGGGYTDPGGGYTNPGAGYGDPGASVYPGGYGADGNGGYSGVSPGADVSPSGGFGLAGYGTAY